MEDAKKCIHILRDAQTEVRRNQKCLDADGNHFEHLLYLHKSNVTSSFVIGKN